MSSVTSVRIPQGTELVSARLQNRDLPQILGFLGFLTIILTALVFGLTILSVDYTCFHVAATLAAVENSNPTTEVCLNREDSNDFFETDDTDANTTLRSKPITNGLASTIKHLRARGGIWSCFRGFRMYLAFSGFDMGVGLFILFIIPIPTPTYSLLGGTFRGFVASMSLATWQMAWVHLVIADKSPRSSFRRMLGLRNWPKIAPAAALYNFFIPRLEGDFRSLAPIICMIILTLLISNPAKAIFIRVAASMLPEEDDPMVPFDRRFGGKAKPDTIGGSGTLGLKDAWTTFEWHSRIRYAKIVLKASAIELALVIVGLLLIIGEMMLVIPRSKYSSHS
ncbi:uncharacterized protein KD926_001804 [Aspergillus affinis]|uniref:uncharacterized protein n=1 Tax=Aspergillus affinis TaxID=1070780 RepID=UPI0022FE637A|nr:uncharacterized protein KD926_001804 [Aspergillus affinis]KAI9036461.1 hypothetical protein KD926_001804 [Aspergillus affinis]